MPTLRVIYGANGRERKCGHTGCHGWIFQYTEQGLLCRKCSTVYPLSSEEKVGSYPRPTRRYEDQLAELPSHSFWLDTNRVRAVRDSNGLWLERLKVEEIVEAAQAEINHLERQMAEMKKEIDNVRQ